MLSSDESLQAERRLATVLFADIVGFTTMAEKMDPEDLTILMNTCFAMMEQVVDQFGGVVDKFIGDCMMGLFGVPFAAGNAAQRAINAAIELRHCLARLNADNDLLVPLDIHIGINTGEVLAGDVGGRKKREYTVMGDTVNIASRLESASVKGQILVGSDTYTLTNHLFRFREVKGLPMKGKEAPVRAYELLSVQKNMYRKPCGHGRSIRAPVVGRNSEIAFLKARLKMVAAGQGGIINLVGEAGAGKTRLVSELKNTPPMGAPRLLEGRAIAIGKNFRFHLFVDLLRQVFDVSQEEVPSADKMEKKLGPILADDADEVMVFAARVMGIDLPARLAERLRGIEAEALELLIKKNIRRLLSALSEKRPLVVILEDLHWADKSSSDLLDALFDLAANRHLLFINVFRPFYSTFCDRLEARGDDPSSLLYDNVILQPLSRPLGQCLIEGLLNRSELPGYVHDQVLSAGSGNPLYIEEILRALIDNGIIKKKNDSFQMAGGIDRVTIPLKISDVIMERIDRLDPDERDVVRVASVIGQRFFFRIITHVMEKPDTIEQSLDTLTSLQFFSKTIKADEVEYNFNHELLREAAYNSLLKRTKQALHLKTANAIEHIFAQKSSEFYGMLAYHYGRAGDAESAEHYMFKAGEEALKTGASSEALFYSQKALHIYLENYGSAADLEKKTTLEKNIAFSLYSNGRHAEAAEHYRKILAGHGITSPQNKMVFAAGFLVRFIEFIVRLYLPPSKKKQCPSPKHIELIDIYYHMLVSLSSVKPRTFFMEVFFFSKFISTFDLTVFPGGTGIFSGIGIAFSWSNISFALSKKVLRFIEGNVRPDDTRSCLYLGVADLIRGYYTGDWNKPYDNRLVEAGLAIGEVLHVAVYISFHGRILIEQGRFREAKVLASTLAAIGHEYSHDFARALKYYLNSNLLLKNRKLRAALIEAQEGIAFMVKKDFKQLLVVQYSCQAKIHVLLSDLRAAEKSTDAAALIQSNVTLLPPYRGNYFLGRSYCELLRLEIMLARGQQTASIKKHALSTLRNMMKRAGSMACDRTEACRLMGRYYMLTGNRAKTLAWLRKSVHQGDALSAKPELARAHMDFGLFLSTTPIRGFRNRRAVAEKNLARARRLFKEMDLEWDSDRLRQQSPV